MSQYVDANDHGKRTVKVEAIMVKYTGKYFSYFLFVSKILASLIKRNGEHLIQILTSISEVNLDIVGGVENVWHELMNETLFRSYRFKILIRRLILKLLVREQIIFFYCLSVYCL